MQILIETEVNTNFESVFAAFDEQLFMALNPPIMPVKLRRFDGCQKGDLVQIELPIGLWESLITENGESDSEIYFIDEGRKLPFPLKKWRHQHRIQRTGENTSLIIDKIDFSTNFAPLDWLMYPVLYLQFLYRKPVYRKRFGKTQ